MALIFITIVALFATVALTKNETTSIAGQTLRDRGKIQYALDAGIERGLDRLRREMLVPTGPHSCADAGDVTDLDAVTLNDQTVTVTCENIGGTARDDSSSIANKALVILNTSGDALRTYGSSSADVDDLNAATCTDTPAGYFKIGGPVYLAGPQTDSAIGPPILVCGGDAVQYTTYCSDTTGINAMQRIRAATATFVRDCTGQTATEAQGTAPSVEGRPPGDNDIHNCHADFSSLGVLVGTPSCTSGGSTPGVSCRVFYPGRYSAIPPVLTAGSDANYFASGTYLFDNIGAWNISSEVVFGATITGSGDTGHSKSDTPCALVTDAAINAAAAVLSSSPTDLAARITSGGATLVLDGSTQLELTDRLTVHSPAHLPSSPATTIILGGYNAWTPSGAAEPSTGNNSCSTYYALCNSVSSSHLNANGRLWAPTASFNLFASAATDNLLPGGAVVSKLRLGASTSGSAASSVSTFGGSTHDAPPYRTVKLVSSTSGSSIKNIVIAEISNFNTFRPRVFSWRTGLLGD